MVVQYLYHQLAQHKIYTWCKINQGKLLMCHKFLHLMIKECVCVVHPQFWSIWTGDVTKYRVIHHKGIGLMKQQIFCTIRTQKRHQNYSHHSLPWSPNTVLINGKFSAQILDLCFCLFTGKQHQLIVSHRDMKTQFMKNCLLDFHLSSFCHFTLSAWIMSCVRLLM